MTKLKCWILVPTYCLAAFVKISNISAVTDPILTKLFGPNFLWVIIFVHQNIFGINFFRPKPFSQSNFFQTQIFLAQQFHLNPKFFQTQNFLDPRFLRQRSFFKLKILPDPKSFSNVFSDPKSFSKIFFDPRFIWANTGTDFHIRISYQFS